MSECTFSDVVYYKLRRYYKLRGDRAQLMAV